MTVEKSAGRWIQAKDQAHNLSVAIIELNTIARKMIGPNENDTIHTLVDGIASRVGNAIVNESITGVGHDVAEDELQDVLAQIATTADEISARSRSLADAARCGRELINEDERVKAIIDRRCSTCGLPRNGGDTYYCERCDASDAPVIALVDYDD